MAMQHQDEVHVCRLLKKGHRKYTTQLDTTCLHILGAAVPPCTSSIASCNNNRAIYTQV